MNLRLFTALGLLALSQFHCNCRRATTSTPKMQSTRMNGHVVTLDAQGKLTPWRPYDRVVRLAFQGLARFPVQDNGLETWLAYSRFEPDTLAGVNWPNNPAGLNAMLVDSALGWYAFSGDHAPLDLAKRALDHQLEHGTTPSQWSWARVPFSSAMPGATDYGGADDREFCGPEGQGDGACGRGDGIGVLEPDKVGELGYAYLRFFELTDDVKYRDAALACASSLASHVREGDELHSPWPFRVYADSNTARDEYSGDVIGAIMLFDELARLSLANDAMFRARGVAFRWLMTYPMQNDVWGGYFEDIPIYPTPGDNPNQYAPLQTAKYFLEHPELDPAWKEHVAHLLSFVKKTFGVDVGDDSGVQFGAEVMSEQIADMAKMSSHTARFGAMNALWAEKTGDEAAAERGYRSLNWATYWIDDKGIVKVGPDDREGWWFSDGYGDYVRHFLVAMAAKPSWAPAGESHLLRSTSVVKRVSITSTSISYTAFDLSGDEVLRLSRAPRSITVDGESIGKIGLEVTSLGNDDVAVRLHRTGGHDVVIAW